MQGRRRSTRSTLKKVENALGAALATPATAMGPTTSSAGQSRKSVAGDKAYTDATTSSRTRPIVSAIEDDITNMDHQRNLPFTLTTNTSTLAPNPVASTLSVNSSYNANSPQSSEIFNHAPSKRRNVNRSSSKGTSYKSNLETNEVTGNRTKRSFSRPIYGEDDSDEEVPIREDTIYEEEDPYQDYATYKNVRDFTCRQLAPPTEFGGTLGITTLLFLSPLLVCFLQWCCLTNDNTAHFASTKLTLKSIVADTFYGPAVGAYLTFIFAIFILSVVLPGRYVRVARGPSYKFTAFPVAMLCLVIFVVAEYYKYPVAEFIIQHYERFGIYGVLIAYMVALWVYVRSHTIPDKDVAQSNVYGKTGKIIIDYGLGSQVNPKLMRLVEFKEVFYRICLMNTLLYTMSLIYETVQFSLLLNAKPKNTSDILWYFVEQTKHDKILLVSSFLLLLYVMDDIYFEHHLTFSFEMQGEGLGGLLLLRYALSPYLLSAIPTYFFWNRVEVKSSFVIYVAVALFFVGLFLKRGSNRLKYKYRLNPNHEMFHNAQTIHTYQGRRLLLHSMWGVVRQPNYLGDILALLAMCLLLSVRFRLAPCLSTVIPIIILIHRCRRVNARNIARYHSSWVLYCRSVPYYLVPYVY